MDNKEKVKMSFPEYPNSPYPDRPAMEVLKPYSRFTPGQIYWPQAIERDTLVARGLIKYWTPPIEEASPVNRMMRPAKRGRKAGR